MFTVWLEGTGLVRAPDILVKPLVLGITENKPTMSGALRRSDRDHIWCSEKIRPWPYLVIARLPVSGNSQMSAACMKMYVSSNHSKVPISGCRTCLSVGCVKMTVSGTNKVCISGYRTCLLDACRWPYPAITLRYLFLNRSAGCVKMTVSSNSKGPISGCRKMSARCVKMTVSSKGPIFG